MDPNFNICVNELYGIDPLRTKSCDKEVASVLVTMDSSSSSGSRLTPANTPKAQPTQHQASGLTTETSAPEADICSTQLSLTPTEYKLTSATAPEKTGRLSSTMSTEESFHSASTDCCFYSIYAEMPLEAAPDSALLSIPAAQEPQHASHAADDSAAVLEAQTAATPDAVPAAASEASDAGAEAELTAPGATQAVLNSSAPSEQSPDSTFLQAEAGKDEEATLHQPDQTLASQEIAQQAQEAGKEEASGSELKTADASVIAAEAAAAAEEEEEEGASEAGSKAAAEATSGPEAAPDAELVSEAALAAAEPLVQVSLEVAEAADAEPAVQVCLKVVAAAEPEVVSEAAPAAAEPLVRVSFKVAEAADAEPVVQVIFEVAEADAADPALEAAAAECAEAATQPEGAQLAAPAAAAVEDVAAGVATESIPEAADEVAAELVPEPTTAPAAEQVLKPTISALATEVLALAEAVLTPRTVAAEAAEDAAAAEAVAESAAAPGPDVAAEPLITAAAGAAPASDPAAELAAEEAPPAAAESGAALVPSRVVVISSAKLSHFSFKFGQKGPKAVISAAPVAPAAASSAIILADSADLTPARTKSLTKPRSLFRPKAQISKGTINFKALKSFKTLTKSAVKAAAAVPIFRMGPQATAHNQLATVPSTSGPKASGLAQVAASMLVKTKAAQAKASFKTLASSSKELASKAAAVAGKVAPGWKKAST